MEGLRIACKLKRTLTRFTLLTIYSCREVLGLEVRSLLKEDIIVAHSHLQVGPSITTAMKRQKVGEIRIS
jgi:hypothetical protein